MNDSDKELKSIITGFFVACGQTCEEVEVGSTKTPDLIINRGKADAAYLELKTKSDDLEAIAELNKSLDEGGIVSRSQPTNYWNTLDGILGFAVKQMKEADPDRSLLRLVWVHCTGFDSELSEMRLKATLYGTQKLWVTGRPNIVTCHYFWNSSFFKYRNELDGVILARGENAQLTLNDHSSKFDTLLNSGVAQAFGTAIYYPRQYELDEDFMINDSCAPRNDERTALDYLRRKYSLEHMQTINMGMHSGFIRVPTQLTDT